MSKLVNRVNKEVLKKQLMEEPFKRKTVSFYRYVILENVEALRDQLYLEWSELGAFGRIYIAREGINAQMSVPEHNWDKFIEKLYAHDEFKDIPFKIAIEDDGKSFYKLTIKVKKRIVADGLADDEYDVTNVGNHLSAEDFNKALEEGAIVVDMRNHYESEIGHFENAICPDADTFREELPIVKEKLAEQKDKKVLLYCTGGIRCEKASAYLKHHGFKDVNQLHGGIIEYARQIRAKKMDCKFKGKNFVFDERIGEKISDEVISRCHQCDALCDTHTNCKNNACHLLFIQCEDCAAKFDGCCTSRCQEIAALPAEKQRELRKGQKLDDCLQVYKSRLRPNLKDILAEKA